MDLQHRALLILLLGCYGVLSCFGKCLSSQDICDSQDCRSIAKRILDFMDPSVNPCQDFYNFTCGRFVKTTVIPDNAVSVDVFSDTVDKIKEQLKSVVIGNISSDEPRPYRLVKTFMQLCMDELRMDKIGLQPALRLLHKAAGWPVLEMSWNMSQWDLVSMLALLYRSSVAGGDSLFFTSLMPDFKNSSRLLITITEPQLYLDTKILTMGYRDNRVKAYYDFMVDVAVIFGANKEQARKELYDSLMLEIELAKLVRPKEESRNFNDMYNLFSVQQMISEMGWLDWKRFFDLIMPNNILPLRDDDMIFVTDAKYLKNVGKVLCNFSKRTISNYVIWQAVRGYSNLLTTELKNSKAKLLAAVYGISTRRPRWEECIKDAEETLSVALGSIYVKNFFDQQSKIVATELVDRLQNEMKKVLTEIDWMDEETRAQALEKISKMRHYVAYPDELLDMGLLDKYYEGLDIKEEGDFMSAYVAIHVFNRDKKASKLRTPLNKGDWEEQPPVIQVNAFYNPLENAIKANKLGLRLSDPKVATHHNQVIPASILQNTFFDKDLPIYINLAKIGLVVGHEITHGFDDQGSQMDADGNLRNWWGNESLVRFKKKSQCMVNLFNKFSDPITNMKINGFNFQGETVADQGGLKLLYRVWERLGKPGLLLPGLENYTREQVMLMTVGNMWCEKTTKKNRMLQLLTDAHPTSDIRVDGMIGNFPEFKKIFQCNSCDRMVSREKCVVW